MKTDNLILNLTFSFSREIMKYTEGLEELRKYGMAKQLFRSGTSIGANVRESQYAESRKDFIHKLKIAEKEANETEYWLLLCKNADSYPEADALLTSLHSIKRVLGKIISSSKAKNEQPIY